MTKKATSKDGPFVTISVEEYNRMRRLIDDAIELQSTVLLSVASRDDGISLTIIRRRSFQVMVQRMQNSINALAELKDE